MKANTSLVLRRIAAFTRLLKTQGRGLWVPSGFLIGGVLAQNLAALAPWSIEFAYSRSFYPKLLSVLSFFSGCFSQTLGEISICFLGLGALVVIGRSCFLVVTRKGERARLLKGSTIYAVWLLGTILW